MAVKVDGGDGFVCGEGVERWSVGGFTIHHLRLLNVGDVGPQARTILLVILIQCATMIELCFAVIFVVV